jgi:hypothetical protein
MQFIVKIHGDTSPFQPVLKFKASLVDNLELEFVH